MRASIARLKGFAGFLSEKFSFKFFNIKEWLIWNPLTLSPEKDNEEYRIENANTNEPIIELASSQKNKCNRCKNAESGKNNKQISFQEDEIDCIPKCHCKQKFKESSVNKYFHDYCALGFMNRIAF